MLVQSARLRALHKDMLNEAASGITGCILAMLGMFANVLPITPGGLVGLLGSSGGAILIIVWQLGMLLLGLAGGITYLLGAGRKSGLYTQYGAQSGR